nr:immunoglobulin heavy chain junction region [Mus musculus]
CARFAGGRSEYYFDYW